MFQLLSADQKYVNANSMKQLKQSEDSRYACKSLKICLVVPNHRWLKRKHLEWKPGGMKWESAGLKGAGAVSKSSFYMCLSTQFQPTLVLVGCGGVRDCGGSSDQASLIANFLDISFRQGHGKTKTGKITRWVDMLANEGAINPCKNK